MDRTQRFMGLTAIFTIKFARGLCLLAEFASRRRQVTTDHKGGYKHDFPRNHRRSKKPH